jgi:HTH-type transcriptional regulator, sugar sensing transcriptional regulator
MLISTLQQIGLTENQAKIYLACLELGETTIKDIAQKSGVKRTTIYDFIEEMINSGILKQAIRGKKKKFIAIEPDELRVLINRREALLNQILPALNSLNNVASVKPKIWFFEGIDGLKKVYEDLLNYKNLVVYGFASEDIPELFGKEWVFNYVKKRVSRNIEEWIIYPFSQTGEEYRKFDKEHKRKSKVIDPKKYNFEIEINIYKNRIAMTSARDKAGVIIESEPISNTWKQIFKMCWNSIDFK